MNNLDAIYDFILNELRKLTLNENFYFKPIKPKLSDLELIAIKYFCRIFINRFRISVI